MYVSNFSHIKIGFYDFQMNTLGRKYTKNQGCFLFLLKMVTNFTIKFELSKKFMDFTMCDICWVYERLNERKVNETILWVFMVPRTIF